MPHCIVEYAKEVTKVLGVGELNELVYQAVWDSNLFQHNNDIKVRSVEYNDYRMGDNKVAFIHVVLKILSGRTLEQRTQLSQLVLERLQQLNFQQISLTVEVIEIERNSYAKKVI